jgi:hypothetical protein
MAAKAQQDNHRAAGAIDAKGFTAARGPAVILLRLLSVQPGAEVS